MRWGRGGGKARELASRGVKVLAHCSRRLPSLQIQKIHLLEKKILTGFDCIKFPESFFILLFREECTFFIWVKRM